jgi:hypothetical protein
MATVYISTQQQQNTTESRQIDLRSTFFYFKQAGFMTIICLEQFCKWQIKHSVQIAPVGF